MAKNKMEIALTNFVQKYGNNAKLAAAGTAIFPETILCAAALESGYGKSELAAKYNNFFGIKANGKDGWKGKVVGYKTKEQKKDGTVYWVTANFRHYDTATDSFKNYVNFIQGPRYIKAGVNTAATPVEQFQKIKDGGYATDISYPTKLKNLFNSIKSWPAAYPVSTGAGGVLLLLSFFF